MISCYQFWQSQHARAVSRRFFLIVVNGHHMDFRHDINAYIYDKLINEFVIGQVLTQYEELK
jgi:hypothetical protein